MSSRGLVWSGIDARRACCCGRRRRLSEISGLFSTVRPSPRRAAILAPVSEAIYGTGTVEPERWAKVVPLQRRRLVELCRCEGQAVKAGQVLGRQDDAEEVSALHELEINNEQLARDLRSRRGAIATRTMPRRREYEQRSTQFEEVQIADQCPKSPHRFTGASRAAGWHGAAPRRRGRRDRRADRCAVLGRPADADAGGGRNQRRGNHPDCRRGRRHSCEARPSPRRRCGPRFRKSRRRAIRRERPFASICCCRAIRHCGSE